MKVSRVIVADDPRPRYYDVRGGRAFWAPGKFAAQYGFEKSVPLGEDGPAAKAQALKWNARLDQARKDKRDGAKPAPRYGKGTLGTFYEAFRATEAWAQMAPRTREDYERAWPHIERRFGRILIGDIRASDSEAFHVDIHPAHKNKRDPKGARKLPWNTAHRVLKVWRALLNALVDYEVRPTAPIGRVTNPMPPPREALWFYAEVVQLIEAADELELDGMALAIRFAWDAMLAPIDALQLRVGGLRAALEEIRTQRQKSGRKVFAAITPDTVNAAQAYLAKLERAGEAVDAGAPLIRDGRLKPYRGPHAKKYFERDFRRVRERAFPGDRRQFLDLRRSAITEGRMGGASYDDLGANAANNLGADQALQSTYALAASKKVQDARLEGRAKMAEAAKAGA